MVMAEKMDDMARKCGRSRRAQSCFGAFVRQKLGFRGTFVEEMRMNPEAKLAELGLKLPAAPAAGGNYVPTVRVGNLLYCAGTISALDGKITHEGQVGKEQTIQTGYESAKICILNTLANIKAAVGSLDQVARFVYVGARGRAFEGEARGDGEWFRERGERVRGQPGGDQRRERSARRDFR
jgi:enamine deaminase RidA (YjgF/YER057c/UK114 family)